MKTDSYNRNKFIFYFSLLVLTLSFNNQSQSNQRRDFFNKKNNPKFLTETDAGRLNYKTGVRSILEDSKGNIWFGSYGEGVCLLQNGKFHYFTIENGLSDNQVRNIYEDKNGLIWFECGRGLSTYNGENITVYKERNYGTKNIQERIESSLWFKGDQTEGYSRLEKYPGVYQYDGQKLNYHLFPVTTTPSDGFKYYISTSFVEGKDGIVWLGTYGAVLGYKGSDFKLMDNKYFGLNSKTSPLHVRSIFQDKKGNLWIGNNGIGVLKYDGKKIVNFTEQQKLKKEHTKGNSLEKVFSICEDSLGNIWFGTVGSGVWKYDGHSMKNFTKENGLESNHIWTIYTSGLGELWFGGANPSGVYKFNGHSFERKY
ncbi:MULTISPECIES: two-component regulator propeller domain-containing protein [Pedobacter]|uniref:ligand-binding sensor domain-containing protein n=1 Tax=Pedobacter TaxID=84567 RepID=UPI001E440478|nr:MULTISPECIES: two-component regulator propeller domain-containing protein [Pedobacter]